ncbi:MAG: hypothetical protein M3R55_01820 [Acidobacteriota bacterium]|nr:hypothetical protein [Acidobacteriota bacterium]
MKRVCTVLAVLAAVASLTAAEWVNVDQQPRNADVEGTWSARVRISEKADGQRLPQLQLQMNVDDERSGRNWNNWGQSVPLAAFTSLPASLDAPQDVKFELRRDAGVIRFEGRFEDGRGVGHLFFTANREFERAMKQQTRDTFNDRELFSFALMDVSREFVKELHALGFKTVTLEDAHKLRIHGVSTDYIANLKAEGLQDPSLDEVLKFRIHGVTSAYVKEMRAAGLGTDLEELLKMRIHGVSTGFVRDLAALGYRNLDAGTLVKFRIHGVTPAFITELKESGYTQLSAADLVDWAIHGRRLLRHKRK